MNGSPDSLELLSIRVEELEKRVHALEHPNEARTSAVSQVAAPLPGAATTDEASFLQTGSLFPTFGRAMLGIAGAYVLRAFAQAGLMPKAAVAAAGIVYACAWLVWAARSTKAPFVQIVYAGTSALILVPMLWETTLYFRVFPASVTAGVLAAFATLATALAWSNENTRIVAIAHGATAAVAVALAVATHSVLPFVYLLLVAVLLNEYAQLTGRKQGMGPFVSLITDAAIWGLIFIYSGPPNARGEYPELPAAALIVPACLLFAIDGTSVAVRVVVRERRISIFDAIQTMIAFLLAVTSVLFFAPPRGTTILGVLCLMLSGALYAASFRRLRQLAEPRSFRIFAMWSAALLLTGALWALPRTGAAIALAGAAVIAYLVARRTDSTMLDLHGAIFLMASAGFSAMPQYMFGALAGSLPGGPAASFVIISCCAVAAFVATGSMEPAASQRRALEFIPALVATCGLTALLARGVLAAAALVISLDVHHLAFLRTLTICVVALALAYAGSRLGRAALTHMAYVTLAFVAAKLLFEDLRHGHMEFIAGSISLFAITLIAVPRLVRQGARPRSGAQTEMVVHGKG